MTLAVGKLEVLQYLALCPQGLPELFQWLEAHTRPQRAVPASSHSATNHPATNHLASNHPATGGADGHASPTATRVLSLSLAFAAADDSIRGGGGDGVEEGGGGEGEEEGVGAALIEEYSVRQATLETVFLHMAHAASMQHQCPHA